MSNLGQQFNNVLDLGASRKIKAATGQSVPVRVSAPDSPALTKHEDEAMALGNPTPAPKKSMFDKTMEYLGL